MKKLFLSFLSAFWVVLCQAQITLDHTLPNSASIILFSSAGEKIYSTDTLTMTLLNMDYSPYKTITYNQYPGWHFIGAYLVSDNLFNSDNSIEFMATYYNRSTYQYRAEIVTETGTVLQDLGYCSYATAHLDNSSGTYKLYAPVATPTLHTDIYRLPGTIPCGQCGSLGIQKPGHATESITLADPKPNPTNGPVLISYHLPASESAALLSLYNSIGTVVRQVPVFPDETSVKLDVSTLPKGMYWYSLKLDDVTSESKSLIIQ